MALTDDIIEKHGLQPFVEPGQQEIYQATGCAHCMETGYAGRTSIHELFPLDDEMHRVIMSGADATSLHSAARGQGMITLYEDGLRKVVRGITSLEEVMRVTQDQSDMEASPEAVAVDLSMPEPASA